MTCQTIKWVSGNTRPLIKVTLKDKNTGDPHDPDSWLPLDVSGGIVITMSFRKKGTALIIDTLSSSVDTDGTDGKVTFTMTATAAASIAGGYEGEINLDYGGPVLTVYDTLGFLFRDSF